MRKTELVEAIANKTDMSKEESARVIAAILEQITLQMSRNEALNLVGFGSFTPKVRAARKGKNPRTGAVMDIPASKTVTFKAGKQLKDAVDH